MGRRTKILDLPFDPADAEFNRQNALYLAHAADIAYHRRPARAARQRLGLETVAFCNKITRTRGFLGIARNYAVLAYRGSDPITLPNWVTDAVVKLVAPMNTTAGCIMGSARRCGERGAKLSRSSIASASAPCSSPGTPWAARWRCSPRAGLPAPVVRRPPLTPSARRAWVIRPFAPAIRWRPTASSIGWISSQNCRWLPSATCFQKSRGSPMKRSWPA